MPQKRSFVNHHVHSSCPNTAAGSSNKESCRGQEVKRTRLASEISTQRALDISMRHDRIPSTAEYASDGDGHNYVASTVGSQSITERDEASSVLHRANAEEKQRQVDNSYTAPYEPQMSVEDQLTFLNRQFAKARWNKENEQRREFEQRVNSFLDDADLPQEKRDYLAKALLPASNSQQHFPSQQWLKATAHQCLGPSIEEPGSPTISPPATPDNFRGRTLERSEHNPSFNQKVPQSRESSASSARSMIDERLEWAHQDRVRSASRDRPAYKSPFREHSPFREEHAQDSREAWLARGTYTCKCCIEPEKFDTLDDLEYAPAAP